MAISLEVRQLIRRMSRENQLWGAVVRKYSIQTGRRLNSVTSGRYSSPTEPNVTCSNGEQAPEQLSLSANVN
jgi:hypothetical protein